jgi:hypothetical protein
MVNIPQGRLPTNLAHDFSKVPRAEIPRASFKRVHTHKTTFDAGKLIPIYVDEALPGDTFNMDVSILARLASPLQYPIMDNLYLDSFFFAVPLRLLWENWERMNGAQDDPGDSTDYLAPQIAAPAGGWLAHSLSDYFGLPTEVENISVTSFWHRAYNLIWNEWFRDQNLQNSVVVDKDDGPDTDTDYVILNRGKRHDYFTSCLPWPQKSDAGSVSLPLGTTAPVTGIWVSSSAANSSLTGYDSLGDPIVAGTPAWSAGVMDNAGQIYIGAESTGVVGTGNLPQIYASLADATAATVNQLREAFQQQVLYERDARSGTRYTEILQAHFGVTSPDFRLQRPEYLGGSTMQVNITPIAQTSESNTTDQGTLAAVGAMNGRCGFTKSFTEHCVLIGLVSLRADLTYQQGIHRMFSRRSRFDWYWPALAHLGEQAVLNKEIFAVDGTTDTDTDGTVDNDEVFGYQERWAEYRYSKSLITGAFRSNYATPLDAWHLSEEFATCPVLNDEFIECDPPLDRVVAVTSEPHVIFDSFFRCNTVRPMPLYSIPGLIDHF